MPRHYLDAICESDFYAFTDADLEPPLVKPTDPSTPAEWQAAVDAAEFLLRLHSARVYGLVVGGPTVDVDRCAEILQRGREHGYEPTPDPTPTSGSEVNKS